MTAQVMNICIRFFLLLTAFVLQTCSEEKVADHDKQVDSNWHETDNLRTDDEHLIMGNPGAATQSADVPNNFLIIKNQYALSYNRDRGTANWVSWHLDDSWLGNASRHDDFSQDTTLPHTWFHASDDDYNGTGFDRGHHCPSGDRTYSNADNASTFLMTNIIPQAPVNNQQTWAKLEGYCRDLVSEGYELYIIMGSYGIGGVGRNGPASTIANGNITVPERIWKTILVLPKGTGDVSRVSASTRLIAVDIPNINEVSTSWGTYRVSADDIERATGYNLYASLPASIQSIIESRLDTGPTN